ncbi:ATP-binding cassette domain-containing protein [Amycolatopsis sp. RM579]|uniref:ATP-binding cassette domain-containing protein n=2 Tax=Amycolatopsis pithecellobii TaxID=664692 RepID=A0A6N7YVY6_9PSEU|nr:ATP-binding cassette domain-containing protein [Amycolatopsis pithecellobii]
MQTAGVSVSGSAAAGTVPGEPAALRLVNLTQWFGNTQALSDINLAVRPGTIHAFVGENGAGKSTCLGVIAGRVTPTAGRVEVFGERLPTGPRAAGRLGIAAIYQELTIVPALTTQANMFLGNPLARRGFLSESAMRTRLAKASARLGHIPPDVAAGALSVADQQLIEIMRALEANPRVLLFDEPTASLAKSERDRLFAIMRDLRAGGVTMVFVSHNLEEVLAISDAISVFRDGRLITTFTGPDTTKAELVTAMLGEGAENLLTPGENRAADSDASVRREEVLRVENLSVPGAVSGVSFTLGAGEALGIAGLVGAGRTTVLRALTGLEPKANGKLWIRGAEKSWPRTPAQARALGIGLVPEDRKSQGLVLRRSAVDNICLADVGQGAKLGFLRNRYTADRAYAAAKPVGFAAEKMAALAGNLSGGNQQKLLLARWRYVRPLILLADEPTRGIDIGAKGDILTALRELAEQGMSMVIVSSEFEEITELCDRAIVLNKGNIVARIDSRADLRPETLLKESFNAEPMS